jgi:hypothetical protein
MCVLKVQNHLLICRLLLLLQICVFHPWFRPCVTWKQCDPKYKVPRLHLINHGLHMLQGLFDVHLDPLLIGSARVLLFYKEEVFLVDDNVADAHFLVDFNVAKSEFKVQRGGNFVGFALGPAGKLTFISLHGVLFDYID